MRSERSAGTEERSGWTRLERWVVGLLFLLGLALRLQGLSGDLWFDEAFWANRLLEGDTLIDPKRPIGFVLLCRLATSFSTSEVGFRAVPFLASLAMIPLGFAVARRLLGGRGALVATALIATSATFVDFGKEFKPYVFEATVQLVLLHAALVYAERPSGRRLAALGAAMVVAPAFATSSLFVLPGVVVAAFWAALGRGREGARRELRGLGLATALSLAAIVALWLVVWSRPVGDEAHWGARYDVFYTTEESYLRWILERTSRTLWLAFASPHPFALPALAAAETWFWRLAFLAGAVGAVVLRRGRPVLLVLLPIGVTFLFNVAGLWPFGPFRANQFLLLDAVLVASAPLAWLLARPRSAWPALVLALGLTLWRLPSDPGHYRTKGWYGGPGEVARSGNVRRAMRVIRRVDDERGARAEDGPVPIVCDPWAEARAYYLRHHPDFAPANGALFEGRYAWVGPGWDEQDEEGRSLAPWVREVAAEHERFWLLDTWGRREDLERYAPFGIEVERVVEFPAYGYVALLHVPDGLREPDGG